MWVPWRLVLCVGSEKNMSQTHLRWHAMPWEVQHTMHKDKLWCVSAADMVQQISRHEDHRMLLGKRKTMELSIWDGEKTHEGRLRSVVHNHLSLWKDTEKIETYGWCVRIRSPQTGFRSYTWINEIWMLDLGCFILQTFSSWTFFSSNRLGWNIARDGYFPMKYWFMAAKLPKSHWTVATEAVSNTFIIFIPMICGFYDATSLKHNMFQTGGVVLQTHQLGDGSSWNPVRQGAPRQRIPREFMLQPIGLGATQSMVGSRVVNSLKTSTKWCENSVGRWFADDRFQCFHGWHKSLLNK